jgi:gluconate kinase
VNPELLRSQFGDLEEPGLDEDVLRIELGRPPPDLADEIKTKQRLGTTAS